MDRDIITNPEGGAAAHYAQWRFLFEGQSNFKTSPALGRDHWLAILDKYGVDQFLEFIAGGRLGSELAIANGIPLMYLHEWAMSRVPPERYAIAKRAAAEVYVLKSTLSLSVIPDNPSEATAQKTMAEAQRWLAERMDADRWGPPKKAEGAPPAVNIVLNIAKSKPAMKTIEGEVSDEL